MRSLDELIDSPFIVGNLQTYHFEISKVPHRLSMVGDLRFWDLEKKVGPDVERLTREIMAHWGVIPYEAYAYLNVVDKGRGGLEHLDSTLNQQFMVVLGDSTNCFSICIENI